MASRASRIAAVAREIFGTLPNRGVRTGLQFLKKPLIGPYVNRFYLEPIEPAARVCPNASCVQLSMCADHGHGHPTSDEDHGGHESSSYVQYRHGAWHRSFEPKRDFELTRILDNCYELFDLISCQLSSTFVDIDFGFLADQVCKTTSKTLDFCEAKDDVPLALNVGVENTQDVLKLGTLHQR
ncbi:hypothetical protein ACHAXS_004226 [Conticribra weissflogii]